MMESMNIMKDTLEKIKKYASQIEISAGVEKGTIKKCMTELTRQKNNTRKRYCTPSEFNTLGPTNSHVKNEIGAMVINGLESEDWINFSYYVISLLNQMAFNFVRPGEVGKPCPVAVMNGYNPNVVLSQEDKEWILEHPDNGAVIKYLKGDKSYKAVKKKERKVERELPAKLETLNEVKERGYKTKKDKVRSLMKARLKADPNDDDAKFWLKADKALREHDKR